MCRSHGGATKRSAYEAWFALNRRAYQAVLNVAIQAEMNMTSAEVTSWRRCDDDVFYPELHSPAESITSVDHRCLAPVNSTQLNSSLLTKGIAGWLKEYST